MKVRPMYIAAIVTYSAAVATTLCSKNIPIITTCIARHRHCNPRIPHLYWPLALLVNRPINLDQRGISIALSQKTP